MKTFLLFLVAASGTVTFAMQAFGQVAATSSNDLRILPSLYFPDCAETWKVVDGETAGWNAALLDELLDWAGDQGSTSVLILWRGRILAEKHWGKGGGKTSQRYQRMFVMLNEKQQAIEDVASVQKSVVSILVGVALHKNLLQLEDVVSKHVGVGWSKAKPQQETKIKLKHLLSMTSGLTGDLRFQTEAGKRWSYNTASYAVVRDCLVATSGLSVHDLTKQWLLDPVGMKESKWVRRATSITALNAYGFASSARDLARFGLLMQSGGNWAGKKILPNDEYRIASLCSSQRLNPNYGYLWWLNEPVRIRSAPSDTYAANGALGRRVFVTPSEGLVVVRLGDEPKNMSTVGFDREFWRRLMDAKL
jgi:CubicO group peptidase (beta-lactamase class C family)